MNADYRQGQLDLIEELIGYLSDEHDHFIAYVAFPDGMDRMEEDEVFTPGATLTLEGGNCPVGNLKRPFVDSLAMETALCRRRSDLLAGRDGS